MSAIERARPDELLDAAGSPVVDLAAVRAEWDNDWWTYRVLRGILAGFCAAGAVGRGLYVGDGVLVVAGLALAFSFAVWVWATRGQ